MVKSGLDAIEDALLDALNMVEFLKYGQLPSRIDDCKHEFVRINMENISLYACKKNCGLARKVS